MFSFINELKIHPFIQEYAGRKKWRIEPFKGGLLNQNYFLTIDAKRYVLKVYRPEMTRDLVKEMSRVMMYVSEHSLPVVCSLAEEVIDGHTVALYPFVEGTHPSRYRNTRARIRSMGAMLGKVHSVLNGYVPITPAPSFEKVVERMKPGTSLKKIEQLHEQIRSQPSAVRREFTSVLRVYEKVISSEDWDTSSFVNLPIRYIHGDYHMQNVLMKGNGIVTILDWEKSGWHFRGYEIMRSIIHNCRRSAGELHWPLIEEYIKGYRQYAAISEAEAALTFECGYRPLVFGFWTLKQYVAGHKHFRYSIMRRKEMIRELTKRREEYGERIRKLLLG